MPVISQIKEVKSKLAGGTILKGYKKRKLPRLYQGSFF